VGNHIKGELNLLKKVLILGGNGMLGHALFVQLSLQDSLNVYATVRSPKGLSLWFSRDLLKKIYADVDANNFDSVTNIIASIQPDIVINCIGLVSEFRIANDLLSLINVNARFPHQVALLCQTVGAKLIHISTDGVFDGKKGIYTETDEVNINDIYGMSKFLGEVRYPHCLTLRTSIIGHELKGKSGLVEWFLAQNGKVRGYSRAMYSGFPTIELAKIISDYILPNDKLAGIYHISSEPISKYDLLCLIADRYNKKIDIKPSDKVVIDRSLDSSAFRSLTGYTPPSWPELVNKMYLDYIKYKGCMYV
jgi:dTDP-4-dehydrorhamnose reductase